MQLTTHASVSQQSLGITTVITTVSLHLKVTLAIQPILRNSMKFMQLSRIHIAHATKHKSCISRNSMQHVGAYLPTHLRYNCQTQDELSPTVSPKQLLSKNVAFKASPN